MGSKAFLLVGLLVAIFIISSQVAARELGETSTDNKNAEESKETNGVADVDAKYPEDGGYGGYPGRGRYGGGYGGNPGRGGYGGYPGGGYGGNPGRGGYGGYPGRGGYGGGGYCRYGCCGGYYGNDCSRCCSYAGQAVDAKTVANTRD